MIDYATQTGVLMALVPSSWRLGFAVLRAPDFPIDWGVKDIRTTYEVRVVADAIDLLEEYTPQVLLMEDTTDGELQRGIAAREAIFHIYAAATERGLPVEAVSRDERDAVFAPFGATSKYGVAAVVGEVLPELADDVPAPRKLWESEHHHIPMFEAFALILTHCEACRKEMQPVTG